MLHVFHLTAAQLDSGQQERGCAAIRHKCSARQSVPNQSINTAIFWYCPIVNQRRRRLFCTGSRKNRQIVCPCVNRMTLRAPQEENKMSAEDNIQTIKRMYAAFNNGDRPSMLACLADNLHMSLEVGAEEVPWAGDYHGRRV